MNQHFDTSTFILDQFEALNRADRCRVLDMLLQAVEPDAPIPVFEDVRADADSWAALTDMQTQTIYMVAMLDRWNADKLSGLRKWLDEQEARKAESLGG